MLSIYNETKTPWKMEQLGGSENVTRFAKRKTLPEHKIQECGIQSQTISVLAYTAIINDMEASKKVVEGLVEAQGSATLLTNAKTTVIFNKKAFRPFISEHEDKLKDILLCSLNLKGKKVVAVDNNETFLLEYFIFSGELSFVVSFNCPQAKLTITLLEEDSRKLTTYTFQSNDGETPGIAVDIANNEILPEDESYDLAKIRRFRPARPTHTILVRPNDRELLESVVDTGYHNVVMVTKDNLSKVVADLQAENYRAVTLFVDYGFNQSQQIEIAKKYFGLKKELPREFKTVFILHNDKRVYKLKY
jgi:hypothetical protein